VFKNLNRNIIEHRDLTLIKVGRWFNEIWCFSIGKKFTICINFRINLFRQLYWIMLHLCYIVTEYYITTVILFQLCW